MSKSTTSGMLLGLPTSDCESVGENPDPYPWEAEEAEYDRYLEHLAFLHLDYMFYYNQGFVSTKAFWPQTADDVYNENLFAISWFYEGCCEFNMWEASYEASLYDEAELQRAEEEETWKY
jgi:hypothetical protein